jgi:urease accessory protein
MQFLLDLSAPAVLNDGDGLMLEDGSIVRVMGLVELLAEATARNVMEFVRLAWHLGNRHADVQFVDGKLRFRRDHVLEDLAARLGASVSTINAAFEPQRPAGPAE